MKIIVAFRVKEDDFDFSIFDNEFSAQKFINSLIVLDMEYSVHKYLSEHTYDDCIKHGKMVVKKIKGCKGKPPKCA